MPANTNEWTSRIAAGDPETTAEHTRDTLACHRYLSIDHAGGQAEGETRYHLFFLPYLRFPLTNTNKYNFWGGRAEVEKLLGVGEDCARFIAAGR